MTTLEAHLLVMAMSGVAGATIWHFLYAKSAIAMASVKADLMSVEARVMALFHMTAAAPVAPVAPAAPVAPVPAAPAA